MSDGTINIGKCIVEGCIRPQFVRHMCIMHYGRWKLTKNVRGIVAETTRGMPVRKRLFLRRKIVQLSHMKTPCWEWEGSIAPNGYGRITICKNGKPRMVSIHRISAWLWLGIPLKSKKCICHHCDNKKCFNPKHLFLGTHKKNMEDMVKKGRSAHRRGEEGNTAKLNNEQVLSIRKRLSDGEIGAALAREFEVCPATICSIKKRKTWGHLPPLHSPANP